MDVFQTSLIKNTTNNSYKVKQINETRYMMKLQIHQNILDLLEYEILGGINFENKMINASYNGYDSVILCSFSNDDKFEGRNMMDLVIGREAKNEPEHMSAIKPILERLKEKFKPMKVYLEHDAKYHVVVKWV